MLLIEERPSGFRLANGPMSVEVWGHSVEDVLLRAMQQTGVFAGGEGIDVFRNSHSVAMALESVMGAEEVRRDITDD